MADQSIPQANPLLPLVQSEQTLALPAFSSPAFFSPTLASHLAESSSFDAFYVATHHSSKHVADMSAEELQFILQGNDMSFDGLLREENTNQHSDHGRQLDPALSPSSRMAHFVRTENDGNEPFYQLAIELPIEPAQRLTKGYRVDFDSRQDWTLHIPASSSRIAGWKESNLIYTIYHHRLPTHLA